MLNFVRAALLHHASLLAYSSQLQGKDKTAEERRIAICIFDDVAEQCHEVALKYYDTYLPFFLEACNDMNPDIRLLYMDLAFVQNLVALSTLNVVIRDANALQPENIMAYDNAVSAMGKMSVQRESIDSAQIVQNDF
ncbi:Importin-5 [Camellia lanceoleosa]|uniref:Importin-5 n=1 Tax=Camellia lanceoleosa TaxID=1840588 RepID=A0ACC0F9N9_9ERIC|nr:Importin-5 [Camellia lanceoleosa]